jgi:uncharacterized protein (TIGR00251 family)
MNLRIKVKTRAKISKIEKTGSSEFKVWVAAPPSKGEANKEVVKIIASHFGLPPSCVKIIKGLKSSQKVVHFQGVE